MACVRFHNDNSQLIFENGEIRETFFDAADRIDPRSVFYLIETQYYDIESNSNYISRVIKTPLHQIVTEKINLSTHFIEFLESLPLSIYVSLKLKNKIRVTMDEIKDHPVCVAVNDKRPAKYFSSLLLKIRNLNPDFQYEPTTNRDVYSRFKILSSVGNIIRLAEIAFDQEWLLKQTDFLEYLFNCYKRTCNFGSYFNESRWILGDKVESVLQLLLAYPAAQYDMFSEKIKELRKTHPQYIDFSSNTINHAFCVIDTYGIEDMYVGEFICFCIFCGIKYDAVVTENLWNIGRMNAKFYGFNFASVVGALYSSGNDYFRRCIEDIYIELCHRHKFSNSNLQEFVLKTLEHEEYLKNNPRENAEHVQSFFKSEFEIKRHALFLYEHLGIGDDFMKYIDPNTITKK